MAVWQLGTKISVTSPWNLGTVEAQENKIVIPTVEQMRLSTSRSYHRASCHFGTSAPKTCLSHLLSSWPRLSYFLHSHLCTFACVRGATFEMKNRKSQTLRLFCHDRTFWVVPNKLSFVQFRLHTHHTCQINTFVQRNASHLFWCPFWSTIWILQRIRIRDEIHLWDLQKVKFTTDRHHSTNPTWKKDICLRQNCQSNFPHDVPHYLHHIYIVPKQKSSTE